MGLSLAFIVVNLLLVHVAGADGANQGLAAKPAQHENQEDKATCRCPIQTLKFSWCSDIPLSTHLKRWFKESKACAIVLYDGALALSFGDGLWAVPLNRL